MDSYLKLRSAHSGFVETFALDGGAKTATEIKAVGSALHQIYLQRVYISHMTHVDGKVLTIQDDADTPIKFIDYIDDAEGDGADQDMKIFDFGPNGVPLSLGKSLDYVANTAGSGFLARVVVEGYQRLTGPATLAQASSGG